jgi:hypothetical protein
MLRRKPQASEDCSLIKNAVLCDVTPCGSCKNERFGGTYRLHYQSDKNRRAGNNVSSNYLVFLRSVRRLLVTANAVPSSAIIVTLMVTKSSSETSVLTKATRRNIPGDSIIHSHRRENLKSYMLSSGLTPYGLLDN